MPLDSKKKFLELNLEKGYPAGVKIRYECLKCGNILQSLPNHACACKCRNIIIDTDAGRISVKDPSKFSVFEIDV